VIRAPRVCLSGERNGGSIILELPSGAVRYTSREVNRGGVNKPENDDPSIVEPVELATQKST
jgi:hypothetical protein